MRNDSMQIEFDLNFSMRVTGNRFLVFRVLYILSFFFFFFFLQNFTNKSTQYRRGLVLKFESGSAEEMLSLRRNLSGKIFR